MAGKKKIVKGEKSYQIKKDAGIGKFVILNRSTGEKMEGYEDKAFNSPIEAGRFMSLALKDKEEPLEMKAEKTETETEIKKAEETIMEKKDFTIPEIEGQGIAILTDPRERYFETTIREHDEPKRTSEPITDGFNTTYYVALGKKVILPESVINTAREAVYTIIETHQDEKTLRCTNIPRESPRFSIDIHREVGYSEASQWLKAQKKANINIF